jgi:DNA-binding MarR family transcriptional regulator
MYIGTDGSMSNDMATQANVSRQAMSKIVKDLEEQGYITANPDENDRRTLSLFLTRKGKTLATEILKALDQLTQEYKEVIGAKRFESAMQVFLDILEYHEK